MGFKKETKKHFNLIENILLKNAAKRIEDLEEQTRTLENKFDDIVEEINNISSITSNDVSEIKEKMSSLKNEIESIRTSNRNDISAECSFSQQKKYIDNEIKELKNSQLDQKTVEKLISDSCRNIIQKEVRSEHLSDTKPSSVSVEVDYDKINRQINFAVSQAVSREIVQLKNVLSFEFERNNQNERMIQDLQARIEALEKAKTNPTGSSAVAKSNEFFVKDSNSSSLKNAISESSELISHTPLFTSSGVFNARKLDGIKNKAIELKRQYEAALSGDENTTVYIKTVDSFINKICKLAENSSDEEPASIAGKLVKAVNFTIMKNFANPRLVSIIDSFLMDCGIEKRILKIGKKLEDEDYELIGDMPLEVPVKDIELRNTIVKKVHDAYVIYYKDEDGLGYRVIDGQYSIGKFVG